LQYSSVSNHVKASKKTIAQQPMTHLAQQKDVSGR
jgi:hypothetical protein